MDLRRLLVIALALALHALAFVGLLHMTSPQPVPATPQPITIRLVEAEPPRVVAPAPPAIAAAPPVAAPPAVAPPAAPPAAPIPPARVPVPVPVPTPVPPSPPPKPAAKPALKPAPAAAPPVMRPPEPPADIADPAPLAPPPPQARPAVAEAPSVAAPAAAPTTAASPVAAAPPVAAPATGIARTGPRTDASWAGNSPPPYPASARRTGIQGEVRLDVHVGADGKVLDVRLRNSSGSPVLDRSAMNAVRSWRFEPATIDGSPVAEWYHDWKWVFRLEG
jgi:periplasmic protein TonB